MAFTLSTTKRSPTDFANSTGGVTKAPATVSPPRVTSPISSPTKVSTGTSGTNTQTTLYPRSSPPGDVRTPTQTLSRTPGVGYTAPKPPIYATPKTIGGGPTYTAPRPTTAPKPAPKPYVPIPTTWVDTGLPDVPRPPRSTSTPSTPSYPSTPSAPSYPSGGGDASSSANSSSNSSALAQMLAVMMPTATSDQSQSQNVFVNAGGGNGPTAPGQADRSFSGQDPGMKQRGVGNYLDALRAGFWG